MGEELRSNENGDMERQLFTFILMDLVEHKLLTLNEAEDARRIYSEMMKDKAEFK